MMTIYLDGSAVLEPGAVGQLLHLAEAGYELVLVAEGEHPAAGLIPWNRHLSEVPGGLPGEEGPPAWFVTADPATCGDRRAGLRTMLIGPRDESLRPTRCDATARDLRDAVLELLASDAMQ
ncbi:MAG TPA: hypothetical protein VGJ71_06215 [Candidatus Limnocylindrales bacterium]|jgi:hypothetical protein